MIKNCRLCGSSEIKIEWDLGYMAYTGIFPASENFDEKKESIKLARCVEKNGCGLFQLDQNFDLSMMYGDNYGYRSSLNKSMVSHLKENVDYIRKFVSLKKNDTVIDIGSNDGTTLSFYDYKKFNLIGIDPTAKKFREFYRDDILIIDKFFDNELNYTYSKAKIITSFSMFYDLPDPLNFSKKIHSILEEDGVWMLEQSYFFSMIENLAFDTICHEHLEYYTLNNIKWIADRVGFQIIDIQFNDTNGGSFIIVLKKSNKNLQIKPEVLKIIEDEKVKLSNSNLINNFKKLVDNEVTKLKNFLENCKINNKKIFGLGASTKGNVLLQYIQANNKIISHIADVNEYKHGRFTPGTKIKIVSDDEIFSMSPDYLLVLPWHFKEFIISKYKSDKYKLVFPFPKFEII